MGAVASMVTTVSELAIVAIPMTLLMIAGEFDLTVGSVLGFASIVISSITLNTEAPTWVAVMAALAVGASIGLLNGILLLTTRIPSFIITLGGLLFWRGAVLVVGQGYSGAVPSGGVVFKIFANAFPNGFYSSLFWFIGIAIVLLYVLDHSKFGNWIFATGGNIRAARGMGIPVGRVKVALFTLTGFSAALAGVIQVSRFQSVDGARGMGTELQAIAAVVIGGTALMGGSGTVVGTIMGCLILAMIQTGLVLGDVQNYWFDAIVGLMIVVGVTINRGIASLASGTRE